MSRRVVSNWGNFPVVHAEVREVSGPDEIRQFIEVSNTLIARGNGRCYGDSSLSENILSTLKLNRILSFDRESNIIECESGVLLSDVLDLIVPKGLFLPVVPGTKFITVGGAIAADVHGKNHHRDGGFCDYVLSLRIMLDDGSIAECSRETESELFWRTCGGMGLTGVIISAVIRLRRIETAYLNQVTYKARNLNRVSELFDSHADAAYSVAWIDCFAPASQFGRSLVMFAEHASLDGLPRKYAKKQLRPAGRSKLGIPTFLPPFLLNFASARAFNTAYYHRQLAEKNQSIVHFDSFFFPLDRILNWNRVYGRKGFLQYQFVLPLTKSIDGLKEILERIRVSRQGSPLAVLKLLGRSDPRSLMSFPMEGYTLALDFKVSSAAFKLLDELDNMVLKYGGRIYLAKDARMSGDTFRRSYNAIVNSAKFASMQSQRLSR